jgi:tyrosyl-tRNA synthetase
MKGMTGKEKFVLATKLLVDKDGKKVGKTTGNALFVSSGPNEFYAGIMSFPDETIYTAFELLTEVELEDLPEKIKNDPLQEKKHLAYEIIKLIWNAEKAKTAQELFEKTFQEKEPDYIPQVFDKDILTVVEAVTVVIGSKSEAKRLIDQGAVDQNGNQVKDSLQKIAEGDKLKIGKRKFIEVKLS